LELDASIRERLIFFITEFADEFTRSAPLKETFSDVLKMALKDLPIQ
jgi:hypothetical protein